jgi:diacylglycerol kinase
LVLIGGMLALELLNTAIEHVVDLVTDGAGRGNMKLKIPL